MTDEREKCAQALEATRANMLGTDDEQHYWDCHEAARLLREAPSADDLVELRELKKLNAEYYDELQRLRSSSPPGEDSPVAWMVWDTKDNEPVEIFGYEQVCHEHINDALANEDSADMAKSWTVRPVHTYPKDEPSQAYGLLANMRSLSVGDYKPEGQQAAGWISAEQLHKFGDDYFASAERAIAGGRKDIADKLNGIGAALHQIADDAAPTPIAGDEGKEG